MNIENKLVSKVFDDIIKSEEDPRFYRGLELSNGMKVLLISDPSTDKSAASMDVQIGSMSEPWDLPGLAHFCEHMLFLGTEKYPSENDYHKFLREHGGSNNAFTAGDNTCYYFDVSPNSLMDALDRFAQFFISPLFTESATEREVNAVDSEHEKNLQIDSWRLLQLEKATCNPKHDYSKFGTGNIDTLYNHPKARGVNIRDELLKFHKQYYSANVMGLTVYGKESLDELMEMVVPLFSNVINSNIEIPEWKEHPFDSEHLKLQGFVVPVKDLRSLNISFPIPDLRDEYHSKPGLYLGHLIGHEGPGSLLSELKSLGWVNNLVSGIKPGCKGFAFFIVDLNLTEEGIEHTDDIVTLLFQYLALLKEKGPQEWIFEECKQLSLATFRFKDIEKPQQYTCSLAGRLFLYPMHEVLSGPNILLEYKPDLINHLLNILNPDVIRIAVVGKKFEDICHETEKWYGTKYHLEPIKDEILEKWKTKEQHPNLKLPLPNEFIPSSFQLVPKEPDTSKFPSLIKNTEFSRLWFKQDDKFGLPKAVLNFQIQSPMAYVDPLHSNMAYIFVLLVKDSLNEYAYAAELAGLEYSLRSTKIGLSLTIKGYNDKQHILLQKIMDKLTTLKIDPKRFEILMEMWKRSLNNFQAEQPHQQAMYYTSMLLSEHFWNNTELLNCIDDITVENVQQMIPGLLARVHIEALIYGNLNEKKALELMAIVETALKRNTNSKFLMPSQLIREREIQLSDGCHYVYEATNEVHSCSAVETYYQCGVQDTRSNILLELLVEMLQEPSFTYLRTQEQLGYIVCANGRRSTAAQGIRIIVQSDKFPTYVDGKIESFIQYFDTYLQEMSDEEFKNYVQSLSALRLEKPKKLSDQNSRYWQEIISGQYNFDRDEIEVSLLATIGKDDLYSFFQELIAYDAPRRKKMSVHVISSTCKTSIDSVIGEYPCISEKGPTNDGLILPPPAFRPPVKIENVAFFKHSLALYPLVTPWIFIPAPFSPVVKKSKL